MAKPFDPRKVLKHIANPLLREFFTRRGELGDVPWDELTEHKIEPIFEAWQKLPEAAQLEVQVLLRDIHELADHRGVAALVEMVREECPERAEEFAAQIGEADKAMWVYLNVPTLLEEAAVFARADALAAGRYWEKRNGLPKRALTANKAMTDGLATALTEFYGPLQMRGRFCKVAHYPRSGGAEYFFAYLDDYPGKHVVFHDDGQPTMEAGRYAFENVFVYNSGEGTMELYAPGGRQVRVPLEAAFCKAVLQIDVDAAAPLRPSYRLDHLLQTDYPLAADPNDLVAEARITMLRLAPIGSGGSVEIKADIKGPPNDIYRKIERWLSEKHLSRDSTQVLKATFRLTFRHDGPGRAPTMTFSVGVPSSCDLKSWPDEQREVGERCLKLWKVAGHE
ncbi:MAG: hypothetical protein IT448_05345 [Phycisphaerales bacterium]|nr:hypothetical protein [Phycisphaerales bacterium]